MLPNAIETLLPDEKSVLDCYRRARTAKFSSVEIHVQDGELVHINYTEKIRPLSPMRLREQQFA